MSVEFTDNSEEVLQAMTNGVRNALEAIGLTAEAHAKEYETAVDTGRLRNSITHANIINEQATVIGTNVEYAPYIEYGANGRKPLHFLKKAATNHTDEYKALAKNALENA